MGGEGRREHRVGDGVGNAGSGDGGPRPALDPLDSSIIEALGDDGRASNADMARHLGVSEGTVRRRLKRLVDEGYVRVVGLPDPAKMGLHAEALIGIRVDAERVDAVADEVAMLGGVEWVAMTTGAYDLFAWVALESTGALSAFLRTELGAISGVQRTETFVSLGPRRRARGAVS